MAKKIRPRKNRLPLSTIIPTTEITPELMDSLWSLSQRYFKYVSRDYFEKTIFDKQDLILFRDSKIHLLVGFGCISLSPLHTGTRSSLMIRISNIQLDHRYRGHNTIEKIGMKYYSFQEILWNIGLVLTQKLLHGSNNSGILRLIDGSVKTT